MVINIKIELYDCKDSLDVEELATALKMFLLTNEETEDAKGTISVKNIDYESRLKV